jgi:heme/copper-type cytochrome/quinol oxidase subunit 2
MLPAMSAATPLTKAQTAHRMGTVIVSAALFVIVLVWLVIVAMNLGKAPIYHSDGAVELDQYARAKDILALVSAFLTTVLACAGFWLGSLGRFKPKDKPPTPPLRRGSAGARSAILSVAPPTRDGTYLLTAAKAAHPAAWDLPVILPERSHVAWQHSS